MQPATHPLTHSPAFPQTPEALDAVLGRFQDWASSRKASGDHGLREVPYEEAVSSSRRRWQPAQPLPENRLRPEPGVIPVKAPVPSHPAEPQPKRSSKRRNTASAATTTVREARAPRPVRKAKAEPPQPAFRALLAEAIAPTSTTVALTHRNQDAERQVALSLRVAISEQATIRARAAEAGMSTSAYLRQCALEVDQLREQVRQTLALIGQSAALGPSSSQRPMQAPHPGFLERVKLVFFGGKQARNLSLRA